MDISVSATQFKQGYLKDIENSRIRSDRLFNPKPIIEKESSLLDPENNTTRKYT